MELVEKINALEDSYEKLSNEVRASLFPWEYASLC